MGDLPLMTSHNDARLRVLPSFQRMHVSRKTPLRNIAVPSAKDGPRRSDSHSSAPCWWAVASDHWRSLLVPTVSERRRHPCDGGR